VEKDQGMAGERLIAEEEGALARGLRKRWKGRRAYMYMQRFFSAFSGGLIRDGTIHTSGEHYSMASVS
jgi:hypothetical protein